MEKIKTFEQILEDDYHIQLEETRRDESMKLAAHKYHDQFTSTPSVLWEQVRVEDGLPEEDGEYRVIADEWCENASAYFEKGHWIYKAWNEDGYYEENIDPYVKGWLRPYTGKGYSRDVLIELAKYVNSHSVGIVAAVTGNYSELVDDFLQSLPTTK